MVIVTNDSYTKDNTISTLKGLFDKYEGLRELFFSLIKIEYHKIITMNNIISIHENDADEIVFKIDTISNDVTFRREEVEDVYCFKLSTGLYKIPYKQEYAKINHN